MTPATADGDDPWTADESRDLGPHARRAASAGFQTPPPLPASDEEPEEVPYVPVRPLLCLAVAGFAGLLGAALAVGAQSTAPGQRLPYALVLFAAQALFVLAFTVARHPPAPVLTAGLCLLAAATADGLAVTAAEPGLPPLLGVAAGTLVLVVAGQLIRVRDRGLVGDAFRGTLVQVFAVVVYATPVVLVRRPGGAQAVLVCLAAAAVALVVARAADAVLPRPRMARQVPRGATGVVLGAMLGTLAAAQLGNLLVAPFDPARGAVLGVVAATLAVLADLAVDYAEASRSMAGEAPTFWLARHMQGPLGAYAAVVPAAYALAVFFLP